ncbi:MAG: 4Fe-4S dicluster domain-containing protein [Desulfobacterales bacterium]|nr:4Fe-4S dicluster domain-containing protein [Desulfobacterales bacterium]
MTEREENIYSSYFLYKKDLCENCSECIKACPTHAIRIRRKKNLRFLDKCIGCGECIRVCPTGAMTTASKGIEDLNKDKFNIAIVSPVIYSQFPDIMATDVLAGVEKIGFDLSVDLTHFLELFQFATEEYIKRNKSNDEQTPYISPICPIVIRLITHKFPNLLKNVLPLERPVALFSAEIKENISKEYKVAEEDIELWHITPCPAKIISKKTQFLNEKKYINKSIGVNDIYVELFHEISKIKKKNLDLYCSGKSNVLFSGRSFEWGLSGGEIAGINNDKSIAVSGLKDTIAYLEKIDLGLLKHIDYLELRICPEGCIGGALTAIDKYIAKSAIRRLVNIYGKGRRLSKEKIMKLYDDGYFFTTVDTSEIKDIYGVKQNEPLSLDQLMEIDELVGIIKGRNCGVCGAPDCKTFAEDIVRGKAEFEDCLVPNLKQKVDKKKAENKTE